MVFSPFASVRARAALAATLVVSVALVAAGVAVVAVLRHNLVDRASLESEVAARTVAGSQTALNGNFGSLDLPDDDGRLVQVADSSGKVLAAGEDLHGHGLLTDYAPARVAGSTASGHSSGRDDDDDGDSRDDDDHDTAPARGKVGTDVDRRTVTVKLGDGTHDYAFAAVQGTTYDGRAYTVYAGTSLEGSQATLGQVTRSRVACRSCSPSSRR